MALNSRGGSLDKFCLHEKYGQRFVELKVKKRFTIYQLQCFPIFHKAHVGIWVFMDINENEYKKLFMPPNWLDYVGKTQMEQISRIHPGFFKS